MAHQQSQHLSAATTVVDPEPGVEAATPVASGDPTDVRWGGVIQLQSSRREQLWPLACVAGPPLMSLAAWLLTGDPACLVGIGTSALVVVTAVDHFRVNRGT